MRKRTYQKVTRAAMDVHRKSSTVSLGDESGRQLRRERLDHRDREALRARLAAWPEGLPVIVEGSYGWPWLTDELKAAGHRPELANCLKVEQVRKVRMPCKTNEKDAEFLLSLHAEPTPWWRVWLPPREVRDHREWLRSRMALVRMQTRLKNRIHALLDRQGVFPEFSDLFGAEGRAFLEGLCGQEDWTWSAGAREALRREYGLLLQFRQALAALARDLRGKLGWDAETWLLTSMPGIGLILAHTLKSEIGRLDRFANERKLAAYSLLAPRAVETGEPAPGRSPLGRHVGHQGNRTLKWAWIEAAHGAVRHGGRWRALYDKQTEGGTKNRQQGYMKVARVFLKVTYAVWRKGEPYRETPPPRPGAGGKR
jgi:transposase